jgi:hypothetical protein
MNRGLRSVFWLSSRCWPLATGYTVFEAISPTGILSRALIYGPGLALLWVLALLLFEVVFSRRAWCRYACPIGLTYGVVGIIRPVRIKYKHRRLLPRGRLPQGLSGAARARHRHQGPRRRARGAARPGLHALRPVRGHLPDRFAEFEVKGCPSCCEAARAPNPGDRNKSRVDR